MTKEQFILELMEKLSPLPLETFPLLAARLQASYHYGKKIILSFKKHFIKKHYVDKEVR